MKKLILVAVFLMAFFLLSTSSVSAITEAAGSATVVVEKPDLRIEKLRRFLTAYDSPLAKYAEIFVNTADKYQLDWKLIPAITGVESTFGKFIPAGSCNAYGWANGAYYFMSWKNSIEIVARTLRENYFNREVDTVEKIARIYAPPSQAWAWKVKYFMEKIENFTSTNPLALDLTL